MLHTQLWMPGTWHPAPPTMQQLPELHPPVPIWEQLLQTRLPPANLPGSTEGQVWPLKLPPSHYSPPSTTPLPQVVQPAVLKAQLAQVRLPDAKPWLWQVWPPRSPPSQASGPFLTPSPQ